MKIGIVGLGLSAMAASIKACEKQGFEVEVISPDDARIANMKSFERPPILIKPIVDVPEYISTPPITRAQRRKQQRLKK